MDLVSALTLIGIGIANIGTTIGLFLWSTGNANEFRKESKTSLEENRKETFAILSAIQLEMKDFHGRLCSIEERIRGA